MTAQPRWRSWGTALMLLLAVAASVVYGFWPRPVAVEVQRVVRGPLRVLVEDDGRTRVKERYVVSAPLAGRLSRIVLHAGDRVEGGVTVLATLDPADPSLLDARERAEAEARLKVTEAAQQQAEPALQRARLAQQLAQEELVRAQAMFRQNSISHEELDRFEAKARTATEEKKMAEFALLVAEFERQQAYAALLHVRRGNGEVAPGDAEWRMEIRSPVRGRVLRVFQESSAVVARGAPLLEVGDPQQLEVVVDVLSSDAVRVAPGQQVELSQWGGELPLAGRVRVVEPSGFTKISALGVEEQRVNVIIDLTDPPAVWERLGDEYRVEAAIVVEQVEDALLVPSAALFRAGDSEAVFVVQRGRAVVRPVTLGRRGPLLAEVRAGLERDEAVVVYPSDKVRDGVAVVAQGGAP